MASSPASAAELEHGHDTKLDQVYEVVSELLADGFNPIVFCRFIDTAEYVAEHLERRLSSGYAVAAVTGTLPPDERLARVRELAADETRRPVLAATIYGTDNGIDGIVLDVLLRKHEQIRRALGVSVPVPDRSGDLVQAILEGLLLRDSPGEQLPLAFEWDTTKHDSLHSEWDSAAARERRSITKYAHAGIQPDEVARELAEVRASLGMPHEVAVFTEEALRSLQARRTRRPGSSRCRRTCSSSAR